MNILVLHGGDEFSFLISDAFRISGHMSMKASDIREAREILEMGNVDLVVVSGGERSDGLRLHSYVREFSDCPHVPFVFVIDREENPVEIEPSPADALFDPNEGAIMILDVVESLSGTVRASEVVA